MSAHDWIEAGIVLFAVFVLIPAVVNPGIRFRRTVLDELERIRKAIESR